MAEISSGFRERAAQLVTWLLGPLLSQQQPQTQAADRQAVDGLTRGADDPDTRRGTAALDPTEDRDMTRRMLDRMGESTAPRGNASAAEESDAALIARVEALHQRRQDQQQGQGMEL